MYKFIVFSFMLLLGTCANAQTLAPGDLAFIGFNTDGTDDFAFINLTPIPGGTVIYLTEEGWNDLTDTWVGSAETHLVYTAPPAGLPCGTVVHINETAADVLTIGCSVSGATISIGAGAAYNLSAGDQILAYQASIPRPTATLPTFIAGVHGDDGNGSPLTLNATTGWNDLCCTTAGVARSGVPVGLTNGVNCVSLFPSIGTETDNAKYTGTLTGNSTTLRALINNRLNWSIDDINPMAITFSSFSPSVSCVAPCVNPTVPSVNASSSTVCQGNSSTLNITGTLNNATQWAIYSGSCGGTLVGTTTSSTFVVTPGANTTYFVRGEGGCVTPGSCGSTTVNVSTVSVSSASQSNVLCFGGTSGAASVSPATGGVAPYSYNWTPGNPTGDGTTSVTGLFAQIYTCTATDANGCSASQNFTITAPPALVVTPASQTNVACFGGTNGVASINIPTGGSPSYSYNWTPGNPTGDGTISVTGLSAQTYTCTVTDNNGCTATQNFTITAPSALVVTPASQTNVACFGGTNGAASINTPTGGSPSYSYDWTPGNPTGDGTPSVTGLSAQTYTCTVTDNNGCTATQNFTITEPSALVVTPASQTNISCFGGTNGAASVNTPTGGSPSYSYDWTPGNPTGDGTPSVTGLSAQTYTCTVTDNNGCTATQNFTITEPSALVVTPASQTNISCFGGTNGAASVNTPTGGSPSYSYDWTPGNPTGDGTTSVTGLTAQTYTCTVTDNNGCTATQNFTITAPTALVVTPASQTNISCFGGTNGAASINTPTGGSPSYSYDWTPGNPTGDGTPSVTGLSAQTYTCTVTDNNGCTATQNFTITEPSALVVTPASQTNVACFGGTNGAASINIPTGGSPSYSYDWTPGNPTGDGTPSVTGLSAQTYTCTVTDNNGCTATQNFTITAPSALVVTPASQTNISCFGGTNGAASVNTPTGGSPSYSYDWTPGNPTGDGTTSVTGLSAQTYTCTVTDNNGCTATQNFTITEPSALVVSPDSQTEPTCGNNDGTASVNNATGGTGPYTYDWTPGTPTGDGTTSISGLSTGTWTCTVTDANGCTAVQSFTLNGAADVIPPTAICQNITVNLNAAGNGSLTAADIDGGSTDNCSTVTLSASQTSFTCANVGTVNVILTVTDASGNSATCTAVVTVVGSSPSGTDTQFSCGPFTWIDGITYTSSNNTATWTIPNGAANGCDSISNLDLTIYTVGTPINIAATNLTTTSAEITWNAMSLPPGGFFAIQYQITPGGGWIQAGTASAGSTSFVLTGLLPGTNYEVQVAGHCDVLNSGAWSASSFFTTTALSCNSPITLAVLSNSGNAVSISWSAIPGAGWYEFRYKESSSATWLFGGTIGGAGTNKLFAGLLPNTSYDFEARTFCPNYLSGAWSNTLTVTTTGLTGCALPPAISATTITGSNVTISWALVPSSTYYTFRYKPASSSTWIFGGTAGPSATSKSYTGLTANTLYDFEARSICANGVPSNWESIQFTTASLSGCELPPVLDVNALVTASSIQISWSAVSGAAWYSFQYKPSSSSIWLFGGTAGPAATNKNYIGLLAGTSYDFQIRTHCPNGAASAWSATGTYWTTSGASTIIANMEKAEDEIADKALFTTHTDFVVYPNPTVDEIHVEFGVDETNSNTSLVLLDMSGRKVREIHFAATAGTNTITLDMKDLSNGMYTLFVYQQNNLIFVEKVKKN